jgi:hypothetical protein
MHEGERASPLCGFTCGDDEAQMGSEEEIFRDFRECWQNVPKPIIIGSKVNVLLVVWY